jgi:hypothetical protein
MTAVLLEAVTSEVRMLSNTLDGGGTWLAWGRRWKLAYDTRARRVAGLQYVVCGYQKWHQRVS